MIKKKISFYGCKYFIQGKLLKKQEGFTLIEVIVAFFVVSLLTAILLQSTVTALNTVKHRFPQPLNRHRLTTPYYSRYSAIAGHYHSYKQQL